MNTKYALLLFYTVTKNLEYICKALPGSQSYDPVWQISKLTYDLSGNIVDLRYANSSSNFSMVADDRALYQYSGNLETVLVALENIPVFFTFDLTATAPEYTKQGDDGYIGSTEDIFKNSDHIKVIYEARELDKEQEVFWLSATTLKINQPLLVDQSLLIKS